MRGGHCKQCLTRSAASDYDTRARLISSLKFIKLVKVMRMSRPELLFVYIS